MYDPDKNSQFEELFALHPPVRHWSYESRPSDHVLTSMDIESLARSKLTHQSVRKEPEFAGNRTPIRDIRPYVQSSRRTKEETMDKPEEMNARYGIRPRPKIKSNMGQGYSFERYNQNEADHENWKPGQSQEWEGSSPRGTSTPDPIRYTLPPRKRKEHCPGFMTAKAAPYPSPSELRMSLMLLP